VALTFTAAARASGARVLFVETMARVADPSMSGRMLGRLSTTTLVQWPEALRAHRGAVVCRPALLEDIRPACGPSGEGTFVALGTHDQPFDRLMAMVRRAAAQRILPLPIRIQCGVTDCQSSTDISARDWMSPQEMSQCLQESRVVVCHAGSGVIAAGLRAGHRPLVVARLRNHGEHVDDHQTQLAAKLASLGLAVQVRGEISSSQVERALEPLSPPVWPSSMPGLCATVREFVHEPTGTG
jgi:UDP-N-acetylglucosamine transferase subunit ALG13